jgi:phenylalanyl-tRNA synthetase beta chain
MKVSLNWIKEYTEIELPIDELVQKIGEQLGAVEEVIDLGQKYQGIVIAKVVSCEKHPNADKLKVCLVDDGGKVKDIERNKDGHVQVVCGAPNVAVGQTVAWLPPGATVPSTFYKDPFALEVRELRGVVSNGMLASTQELALGDDHSGIVVLDKGIPGDDFAEINGLNDYIIDIENKMFTHRPDCFGILGVAREIAGISHKPFKSPKWYLEQVENSGASGLSLDIKNELPELVPRFIAVAMSDIKVKSSSMDMQITLIKVGLKPVNNVVDVTNYLMYLTGQPLHAYDYDKVASRSEKGAQLVIRYPKKGEKLLLLNGKTIEPRSEAIMIATGKELIGVGGVMGGTGTEVDKNTKNIILECANFDMYSIRRTSMEHGLFTDAVTRFSKGQSALQNDRAILKAQSMMQELTGGKQVSTLIDFKNEDLEITLPYNDFHDKGGKPVKLFEWNGGSGPISIDRDFINNRLGLKLTTKEIEVLLRNVEFGAWEEVPDQYPGEIEVIAPFWRTDIRIMEDIVEEVGRLYGFDKLPLELPKRAIKPAGADKVLKFKSEVRGRLASLGANEVLTYSFVHGNLLEKTGQNKDLAFKLTNALSPDLQYYRMSLTPSLLAHIHPNIKSGHDKFAVFEIGKAHNKLHKDDDQGVPKEYEILALAYADKNSEPGTAYYQARNYLDELAAKLGIVVEYRPIDKEANVPVVKPFDPERSALAFAAGTDVTLGIVGEFKASVRKQLKLPVGCAGFEVGLQELMAARPDDSAYRPLSRFPSISQDICLEVESKLSYGELSRHLKDSLVKNLAPDKHQTFNLAPIDIYESEKIKGRKRITYRVTLTNYERTLTEGVLTGVLDQVSAGLEKSIQAKRI